VKIWGRYSNQGIPQNAISEPEVWDLRDNLRSASDIAAYIEPRVHRLHLVDRQRRIERPHRALDRAGDRRGVAGGANRQVHVADGKRRLRDRHVDLLASHLIESVVLHVADDADDGTPAEHERIAVGNGAVGNALADRLAIRPQAATVSPRRFNVMLLLAFGTLALTLAALGTYGVISYSVSQRTQEIGIRMALGASRQDVLRMVVGGGLRLAIAGVLIGVALALAAGRFISALLFGVRATDPLTFSAVAAALLATAVLAAWIPARRATRVDPMVALRYEQ
jgi:hypothetical protein